jgi:hypothetical protein
MAKLRTAGAASLGASSGRGRPEFYAAHGLGQGIGTSGPVSAYPACFS